MPDELRNIKTTSNQLELKHVQNAG
jgi:hypothetical protein